METLLSLTSKRAGEWFKEELRELGGLEHIVKTIRECHRHINSQNVLRSGWTDPLLDKLRKVDRCLRVLENVSASFFSSFFFSHMYTPYHKEEWLNIATFFLGNSYERRESSVFIEVRGRSISKHIS